MDKITQLKKAAAEFAVDQFVQSGMTVGLGVGSTAVFAVNRIGEHLQSGKLTDITGIACSLTTEKQARELGIPLIDLKQNTTIDITIDGADEVDTQFNLIKGGGGALLREKVVAQASRREIIVVDESKLSDKLGTKWPVPIEVTKFGWEAQVGFLSSLGAEAILRIAESQTPFETDQGNYIIDANFGIIEDPNALNYLLNNRAGIVEHGLFINIATDLIVASPKGIQHTQR